MPWRSTACLLMAVMAAGGTASALSQQHVTAWDPSTCAPHNGFVIAERTLDVVLLPEPSPSLTHRVVLAGDTSGASYIYPFSGFFFVTVERSDQTTVTSPQLGTSGGSVCGAGALAVTDLSGMFKAGLNKVKITLLGVHSGNGFFYFYSPAVHLVAIQGTLLSPQ